MNKMTRVVWSDSSNLFSLSQVSESACVSSIFLYLLQSLQICYLFTKHSAVFFFHSCYRESQMAHRITIECLPPTSSLRILFLNYTIVWDDNIKTRTYRGERISNSSSGNRTSISFAALRLRKSYYENYVWSLTHRKTDLRLPGY